MDGSLWGFHNMKSTRAIGVCTLKDELLLQTAVPFTELVPFQKRFLTLGHAGTLRAVFGSLQEKVG